MSMRTRQSGITLIGWLVLLLPAAVLIYTGVRLTPVYLNYMKVVHSLEGIKTEFAGNDPGGPAAIRVALAKHLDIESLDYPTLDNIKITRDGRSWVVEAAYDDQAPLFANIFVLVAFDKSVTLGGGGGASQ
jgi:hypothetical protein